MGLLRVLKMLNEFLEKEISSEKLVMGKYAKLPQDGIDAFLYYFTVAQDGQLQDFLASPEGQEYLETLQKLIPDPVVAYRGVLVEDLDNPFMDWKEYPDQVNSFSLKKEIGIEFANRGMAPDPLKKVLIKAELDQSGIVWHPDYIMDEVIEGMNDELAIDLDRQKEITAQYSDGHKVLDIEVL